MTKKLSPSSLTSKSFCLPDATTASPSLYTTSDTL